MVRRRHRGPDPQYLHRPLQPRIADLDIDAKTGLVAASRDTAGLQTSYEYDTLGRLMWVKPPAGHGGYTEYVYSPAASATSLANVLVKQRGNSMTAAVLAQSQIFFDAFGRIWQEKQLLPDSSWNVRETLYDAAGHKASVSELQTGAPTKKTQFLDYDAFGRPAKITPPDGAGHNVTFNFFGTRVTERTVKIATTAGGGESSATTTETYDRQGRLSKVSEPSGEGGVLVTTTYSYDVGNRLKQVETPANVSGNQVTQNRFFSYDNRGFLTSETHPEKGDFGNGTVTYPSYDASGHALSKTDGPSALTFTYDRAERLTQVRETTGAQRPLKSFTYSGANGTSPCNDYRKGKITQQSRFNYVNVNETDFTIELREAMTYCGRDGRLSQRTLEN